MCLCQCHLCLEEVLVLAIEALRKKDKTLIENLHVSVKTSKTYVHIAVRYQNLHGH